MKIKSRLFLSLILVVLMLGLNLPLPAAASTPPIPDEVEVTWEVIITSNYAWSSETTDDEGKIINRYNGNDSFNMQSTGTTKLQRVGVNEDGHPYLSPQPGRKDYNVNGYGGGTEKFWETYTITPWVPGKGWGNPKDFEQTKVEDWQYHMPETGHEIDPEDDAVSWFVIIAPESDKEPVRYQMLFEPFFFIQHDTLSDYIDASGQYQTKWQNFEGSHSESGELMDAPCRGSLHIAGNVWFHRQLNHPSGGVIEGELEFSDNKFRDKGSVQHTSIDGDHGRAEITVKYEINREPSVKAIQPNQVLGRYQYQDDEHYQPATDFVAGKDTVIQAFLSDEIKIDQVNNLELDIYCNDNLVTTLKNPKKDRDNNAGIFIPGDQSKCDWGAGVYKFVARIGYSEKTLYALFEEQRDIRILAVPLKANYGGKIVEPGGNWIDGDSMLRKLYPLADHNVKWIPHPVMVDASQPSANLMDYNGLIAIRWILQCLQPDKFVETPYDAIIGFVADPIPIIKNNKVVGYTLGQGKKPIATVALVDDYPTTVAHEIAHFYDVGDEYDGGIGRFNMLVNPPPFGFQGEDLFTFEPVTSDADYVKPAPVGSGSLISKNLHPFDPRKNKLLPDSISFMGTDAPESKYWISPAIWRHLYHSLGSLGGAANAKTANLTENTAADTALQQHTASATSAGSVLVVSGWIDDNDEMHLLEPRFSYQVPVPIALQHGSYSIQAIDGNGEILASQGFTPSPLGIPGSDALWFDVEVPLPPNTSQLEIWQGDTQGGTLVQTISVSPHPPADLTILQPAGGETVCGPAAIAWTATDPDDDTLYYKVEYSPEGQKWMVLNAFTPLNELTLDFASLPGGSQARLRVTATDGINTTRALSDPFSVPVKAPTAYIQSPANGASLAAVDGVSLSGRAYDLQEGWICDPASLVWTSDKDGELGRGSQVYVDNLSAGSHVITLHATSQTGQTASESIQFTITGDSGNGTDTPQDLGHKDKVPLDYTWTVTFNDQVDSTTVNKANIRVTEATGSPVHIDDVVPGEDGKSALILPPPGGYLPGQSYIITVSNSIRSATGKTLKASYMKRFTTNHGDGSCGW